MRSNGAAGALCRRFGFGWKTGAGLAIERAVVETSHNVPNTVIVRKFTERPVLHGSGNFTQFKGRPSKFKSHPNFVPGVFTYVRSSGDAAVRRHSRWLKRQKGELDTTSGSATPNDTRELQEPPNESPNMDTCAAQDDVVDENSVDLQQIENENPDEDICATQDDAAYQDSLQLQQPEKSRSKSGLDGAAAIRKSADKESCAIEGVEDEEEPELKGLSPDESDEELPSEPLPIPLT
ncbi:hypothetical protein MTO96_011501 [Rhipicephalus appendiculatus]